MKLKEFFALFNDTIFTFHAEGFHGGKEGEMKSQLVHFGRMGPYSSFPNAFVFHVIDKNTYVRKTVNYSDFGSIDEIYLNMNIIRVIGLSLNGHYRTNINYNNNYCSFEIEIIG
jgi:hypothetical protein